MGPGVLNNNLMPRSALHIGVFLLLVQGIVCSLTARQPGPDLLVTLHADSIPLRDVLDRDRGADRAQFFLQFQVDRRPEGCYRPYEGGPSENCPGCTFPGSESAVRAGGAPDRAEKGPAAEGGGRLHLSVLPGGTRCRSGLPSADM